MNDKKTPLQYIALLAAAALASTLVFFCVSRVCFDINKGIDAKYERKAAREGSGLVYPSTMGSGMGLDYLYGNVSTSIKASQGGDRIIVYGASTSIAGICDDMTDKVVKICGGSATIDSYRLLRGFAQAEGLVLREDDVIMIDISPVLFKKTVLSSDVVASALKYGNVYEVSEDLSIKRSFASGLKRFYALGARNIGKSAEYLKEYIRSGSLDALFTPAVNNYARYDRLLSFDEGRKDSVRDFITSFDCKVVVNILYGSSSLFESKAGQTFNEYVDTELIPFLNERGIGYVDTRTLIPDSMYVDNTHIDRKGREIYTGYILGEIEKK